MSKRDAFWLLMGSSVALFACATYPVYNYYGIQMPVDCFASGTLVGSQTAQNPKGWPSLPMSECTPDAALKGKCWIELSADHFAKERELEQCRSKLEQCQGPMPTPAN